MPEKKTAAKAAAPKNTASKAAARKPATLDDLLKELKAIRQQLEFIDSNTSHLSSIMHTVDDIEQAMAKKKR